MLTPETRQGMSSLWLTAIFAELGALVVWTVGWTLDVAALMPIALYAGTIAAASAITADIGRRFLPVTAAQLFRLALGVINVGILVAIAVVHLVAAEGPFMFLSSVSVALWGAFAVGLTISVSQAAMCGLMARNAFRVRSARTKGVGALLVAAGTIGLTLPLLLVDLVFEWPLFTLPSIIVAIMGQRRLDL